MKLLRTIQARLNCCWRSFTAMRSGIKWDGHCWDISGDDIYCTDCGAREKASKIETMS